MAPDHEGESHGFPMITAERDGRAKRPTRDPRSMPEALTAFKLAVAFTKLALGVRRAWLVATVVKARARFSSRQFPKN